MAADITSLCSAQHYATTMGFTLISGYSLTRENRLKECKAVFNTNGLKIALPQVQSREETWNEIIERSIVSREISLWNAMGDIESSFVRVILKASYICTTVLLIPFVDLAIAHLRADREVVSFYRSYPKFLKGLIGGSAIQSIEILEPMFRFSMEHDFSQRP